VKTGAAHLLSVIAIARTLLASFIRRLFIARDVVRCAIVECEEIPSRSIAPSNRALWISLAHPDAPVSNEPAVLRRTRNDECQGIVESASAHCVDRGVVGAAHAPPLTPRDLPGVEYGTRRRARYDRRPADSDHSGSRGC
jgi:hypothetical protein